MICLDEGVIVILGVDFVYDEIICALISELLVICDGYDM